MKRHRGWPIGAITVSFFAGAIVDGWLRTHGPPMPVQAQRPAQQVIAAPPGPPSLTNPRTDVANEPRIAATSGVAAPSFLRLRVPVDGSDVASWKGGFDERRGRNRRHEAVDILSPRNTPVHAVVDGTIAKILESKAGGHTIYEYGADGRRCYYYAHLERYAAGLHDGQRISRGEVIGYVGTTGNAPPNTPHLHFAVFETTADRRWWRGRPLDPYRVFKESGL